MSTPSSTYEPDDRILAEFVAELEKRGSVVIGEYTGRYPRLASQIQAMVGLRDNIEDTRDDFDASVPERLGDFRIVRRLAGGGMGEIYEAVQEHLGRRVAVKVIRRGRVSDQARWRFEREQKVLARLHQTHIVPIHMAGEEGRLQYFVMPYIEGAALHHVVNAARHFNPANAAGGTPTLAELAGQLTAPSRAEKEDAPARTGTQEGGAPTCEQEAAPPGAAVPVPRLSRAYFRSVAAVMADAAAAVHHVHGAGILHRDLKPANIMVGAREQCWIIDFGLATHPGDKGNPESSGAPPHDPGTVPGTVPGTIPCTPPYMAPERLKGEADVRTDVWGLGITLYELLTLQRPFEAPTFAELSAKICGEEPAQPRHLVSTVPVDLEAICLKALRKNPGQRYETAGAVGEDLRRWLRHEPTVARPAWVLRRVGLWARRNTGWAAALVLTLLAVGALVWSTLHGERAAAEEAQRREAVAEAGERRERREVLLQKVLRLRLQAHTGDWSQETWEYVRAAAHLRADDGLRDLAATILRGIDARTARRFKGFGGASLAFDATGQRVVLAGWGNDQARYWDGAIGEPVLSGQGGSGPVAFRNDVPVQLVAKGPAALLLWDMARRRPLKEFKAPGTVHLEPSRAVLTPDGSFLAVAATTPGGKAEKGREVIAVWGVDSGKLLASVGRKAVALALSPDGKLLAAGDGSGEITVWSLPVGEVRATLRADANSINCLAFGRDVARFAGGRPKFARLVGWLLAAGSVGAVVVWDLAAGIPRSHCRDSSFDVHAVAFRADGTTLASTSVSEVKLWEVATGQRLLRVPLESIHPGLAFSPDGQRLAVSSVAVYGHGSSVPIYGPGGLALLRLEEGRGIQTLRGLTGRVIQVRFSPDGKRLAGLATNWQLAIWQRATGQLVHVLSAPRGRFADNAALAFSADGKQFAFSSGEEARLWEVATGRVLKSWKLAPGIGDRLGFHPSGKLLSFRLERGGWTFRDLTGAAPAKPFAERKDFAGGFVDVAATPGGEYFVVEGFAKPGRQGRVVKVFDGLTGKVVWSRATVGPHPSGQLTVDPAGELLAFAPAPGEPFAVVEVASAKFRRTLKGSPVALSPGARFWLASEDGYTVRRGSDGAALVRPGLDVPTSCARCEFSVDAHVAWGNDDGTVFVTDLEEVQRRLAGIGLGW